MGKYLNLRQVIALGLTFAFLVNTFGPLPTAQAQDFRLPAPGIMVHLSPAFNPPILKGLKVHPDNPFRFDFILDKGDSQLSKDALKGESTKLIKYFLASLTIPEKDLWVNLSPYEKDRIIPQSFGLTEMGRDLLAEDYILKQITASLIYPEDEIGKKFWKRIYEEAAKKFGTTNIPVNTFNKVWIVPEKAVVYENTKAGTAYVVESKLKVMLEQDYFALEKNQRQLGDMFPAKRGTCPQAGCQASKPLNVKAPQVNTSSTNENVNALGSQIVREIIIPELTKEINKDKNFSQLRQVYNSLILATWYKKRIKESILSQVYADKNKVVGVNIDDPQEKQKIYERYLQAFKKGTYNYIKEEMDPTTQQIVPRKYFSGGFFGAGIDHAMAITDHLDDSAMASAGHEVLVEARFDNAMATPELKLSLNKFWLKEILELDITELIKSRMLDGTFTAIFRFEGNGFRPGESSMGTGKGKEDDRLVMKWTKDGEIIFERRRTDKVMASAVWVKGKKKDKEGHMIWEKKGDPLVWLFWKHAVNEADITEELGELMLDGKFSWAFRFEADGFQPGQVAIGIGFGKQGDRVFMKWTEDGEVIFELRRADKIMANVVWVKGEKKDKNGNAIWENKGDPYLWTFWKKKVNELDIHDVLGYGVRGGTFTQGFRFEVNGYRPGQVIIGIGRGDLGGREFMKWMEDGNIIFERRADNTVLESAVWVRGRQGKDGFARWYDRKRFELSPFVILDFLKEQSKLVTVETISGYLSNIAGEPVDDTLVWKYVYEALREFGLVTINNDQRVILADIVQKYYEVAVPILKTFDKTKAIDSEVIRLRKDIHAKYKGDRGAEDFIKKIQAKEVLSGNYIFIFKKEELVFVKNSSMKDMLQYNKERQGYININFIAVSYRKNAQRIDFKLSSGRSISINPFYIQDIYKIKDQAMAAGPDKLIDQIIKGWVDGGEEKIALIASDGAVFKFEHHMQKGQRITDHQISQPEEKGGIDLTPANMNLQTKMDSRWSLPPNVSVGGGNDNGREGDDKGIQFHLDPAMLEQLQNAPGFTPVIINIQPVTDLRMFLGLSETI